MKLYISETNINEQFDYLYTFFKPEAEGKKLTLVKNTTLTYTEAIINSDREKIFAILTNLIKNAIKFTNSGTIEFGYNKKGSFLEFYVKDTGIGVPVNQQENVFKRFIQADSGNNRVQGSGLGLAITKALVEMLGGIIWVNSKPKIGSVFYFTIPYKTDFVKEKIIKPTVTKDVLANIKKIKVLVVEDNRISERIISLFLDKYNCEVFYARNGKEAVEICRNQPDLNLVLMDIQLPELNGYEATMKIREFNKDVIIIAQTAQSLKSDKDKALAAGCNEYLSKPLKQDALNVMVRKYFLNVVN